MPGKPDKRCTTRPTGPAGDKTFRFKNHAGNGTQNHEFHRAKGNKQNPYFFFTNHRLELKQNNNDIDVKASLRVHSRGYKTSATDPKGVAPKITYVLKTAGGDEISLDNIATLDFEDNTNDVREGQTTITGRNVDDFTEACWLISDYRIVKTGTRGNPPI